MAGAVHVTPNKYLGLFSGTNEMSVTGAYGFLSKQKTFIGVVNSSVVAYLIQFHSLEIKPSLIKLSSLGTDYVNNILIPVCFNICIILIPIHILFLFHATHKFSQ